MTREAQLVAQLGARGWRLALAESCTGGLVAARITAVPGASAVLIGGVVAYHNDVKRDLLGVPAELLASCGAVSTETALAMARGVRQLLRADLAASVTGIAGPGGGSEAKPVGLVFVAVAGPAHADVERCVLGGSREEVRAQAVEKALTLLLAQVAEP